MKTKCYYISDPPGTYETLDLYFYLTTWVIMTKIKEVVDVD